MKKILFFINTLHTGGAERVLVDLIRKLPKEQYQATVYTLFGGRFEEELPEHITFRSLIPALPKPLRKVLFKVLSKAPKLTARLIRGSYDVEAAYLEGFPTKVIACRKNTGKKIAFVHTNVAQADIISIQYPSKDACLAQYRLFDKVCFVSQQALDGFSQVIGSLDRTQVIHNVVDFSRVRRLAEETAAEPYTTGGRKLIAVGRLIDLKGFDRLIRICAELEQEYPFELFILGSGDQQQVLEEEIAKTNCKSVRLMGMQKNPYAWMAQADLLVCSSFSEGYSTTVVEALALGLPVITTACAGMNEILEGGKWGMITGLSDEELRAGLRKLLSDQAAFETLRQKARQRKDMLSDETAIAEYHTLFEDVTDET